MNINNETGSALVGRLKYLIEIAEADYDYAAGGNITLTRTEVQEIVAELALLSKLADARGRAIDSLEAYIAKQNW